MPDLNRMTPAIDVYSKLISGLGTAVDRRPPFFFDAPRCKNILRLWAASDRRRRSFLPG